MSTKKLISAALTAATILSMSGVLAMPLAANAQSTADLQAQIAALLAQIQQLQGQLNSSGSGSMMMSMTFSHDLTVGSKGADVSALQQLLISKGFLTVVSAPTGFFGPATRAALAKMQAANGISPATGFFGPKTRAFVNAMHAQTGNGNGNNGNGNGNGGAVVPATGLSVTVDPQNPVTGSFVTSASGGTSAARIPVLALDFTASASGPVTVTEIKVHKNGVLADSSINGAYLIQNGQVLYQYNSLNKGVIDFSGLNLQVGAGTTQTLWVAIDPAPGVNAGNTVSFSVASASDITAWNSASTAITPSGNFPLTGGTFTATTVSNPAIAGLTITTSSIGTQVTAGTQNNIVGAWTFNGQNSLVWLKGLKLTVVGSANDADLRNVKLYVNGTQVGQTLPSVGSNGIAFFDLSATPATLNTGNNNVQVYADVMGSPSKNFQFEILNSYDVYAVDSQYNVPILVTLSSGVDGLVTIQQGQITVTQDSGTPTGNIAVGQSGVTLAKFDIYAAGESVKVKFIGFKLQFTSVTNTSLSAVIKNVSLTDDAGGQVGTTINTPPSSASCDVTGNSGVTSAGVVTPGAVTYVDCFGTSASPINYIIPANTTRVLSLKGDIQSTAGFNTVVGSLVAESNNLQGLISSQIGSSSGATGSSLSLATSLLSVTSNSSFGNQTLTPNSVGVRIGSYAFTASSASGVQINTVSIRPVPTGTATTDLQNLRIVVNGTQFGTSQGVVTDGSTYTFSGSPFTVPAGNTVNVDVFADILSSAVNLIPASALNGCSGTATVSFNALSCSGSVNGQNVTVSSSGATMTVSTDSSVPPTGNLVMGSHGNVLSAIRFQETSNVENVKITDLTVKQTTGGQSAFQVNGVGGLALYDNSGNLLGQSGSAVTVSGGFNYVFHFATPIIINQNTSRVLLLKGDVATFASHGATDQSTNTFTVATSTVVALGQSSNIATTVSGGSTSNTLTILRTVLTPSAATLGVANGRTKSSADNIATVTFTANNAGEALLKTLKLTFSGNAIATSTATTTGGGTGFAGNITLRDSSNNDVVTADNATTSVSGCSAQTACTITWTFVALPTSTGAFVISPGQSYTFTLQLNDIAGTLPASGNNSVSLGSTIQGTGDVTYLDSADGTGNTISLPATQVPLNVASMTFAQGS